MEVSSLMPEDNVINQEATSAEPTAGGSAGEEWIATKEATKIAGASARTLKRRADAGVLRRSSAYGQFGPQSLYNKEDLLKLKELLRQRADGLAEAVADVKIGVAEAKAAEAAGGDKGGHFLAEVNKTLDQTLSRLTEPFFKLSNTLEAGLDKLLESQEQTTEYQKQTAGFQKRLIEIEVNRDKERQEEREGVKKKAKEDRLKTRVIIISYVILTLGTLGFFGYLFWLIYSGKLFGGWV